MCEDLHFLDMLSRQAAVTFDLCVKNDYRQTHIRKTTAMLKGFVKLAGKATPAELAHKAGLLCKEVCGAAQASCFLTQDEKGLTSWSRLSDGKAEVFSQHKVPIKGFLAEVFNNRPANASENGGDDSENSGTVSAHLGSLYCPVLSHSKVTGVLHARGCRKGNFSEVDEQMLKVLSGMVAVLQESISRTTTSKMPETNKTFASLKAGAEEIDATLVEGIGVAKTAVFFVEKKTGCFWAHDPTNPNEFIRQPLNTFPLAWVEKNKVLLQYPSTGEGGNNAFTAQELADIKTLTHRFLPNAKLEAFLACPLMEGPDECVAIVLLLNSKHTSGAFEAWVSKSTLSLSAKWGTRLAATLREHEKGLSLSKVGILNAHTGNLFMQQGKRKLITGIQEFVKQYLLCEHCWLLLSENKKDARVMAAYCGPDGPIQVKVVDTGIVEDCIRRRCGLISQNEDSWLATHLKVHVKSAVAVALHTSHSSKVMLEAHEHKAGSYVEMRPQTGAVLGVVVAVNKLGHVDRFSSPDLSLLEQAAGTLARAVENNVNLLELFELKREMNYQGQQRNLILQGAATLHTSPLGTSLAPSAGLLSRTKLMMQSVLQASDCAVYLATHTRTSMFEMTDDLSAHAFIEPLDGTAGQVITTGESIFHSTDEPNYYFSEAVDQRAVRSVQSLLCVPIHDREWNVIGACQVFNTSRGGGHFKEEDEDLLGQLTHHLLLAIENTSLITKMSSSCQRLAAIEPEVPPDESVVAMGQFLEHICSAERVNMFVRDGQCFRCRDVFTGQEMEIHIGKGFVGRCAESQTAIFVHHMLQEALFNPQTDMRHGITITHALFVPILSASGETRVVVEVLNKTSGMFDSTDQVVAQLVGMQAHALLHKALEIHSLEEARTQALSLLTSVQYLYPYTGGCDTIIHSAVGQMSIVMGAAARVFLSIFNDKGEKIEDMWKSYDSSTGSPATIAIQGVAGSCYSNVAPVRVEPQDVAEPDAEDPDRCLKGLGFRV